ncbi:uncharacterized protein EV420DRAFT_1582205, partial [Desarmillaria tabescens]
MAYLISPLATTITWVFDLFASVLAASLSVFIRSHYLLRLLPPGPPGHWLLGNEIPTKCMKNGQRSTVRFIH